MRMADELVRDHRLDEHRQQRESQDLRERDDEQLLHVLQHLEVVVSGERLHGDAGQHRQREQQELDDRDRREFGEPVDRLAHRQRIVDAVEMRVALAPDQLTGVEGGDDVEEQRRAALHGLEHEVRDRPDVLSADCGRRSGRC